MVIIVIIITILIITIMIVSIFFRFKKKILSEVAITKLIEKTLLLLGRIMIRLLLYDVGVAMWYKVLLRNLACLFCLRNSVAIFLTDTCHKYVR